MFDIGHLFTAYYLVKMLLFIGTVAAKPSQYAFMIIRCSSFWMIGEMGQLLKSEDVTDNDSCLME